MSTQKLTIKVPDGYADVKIVQDRHPWAEFLLARKVAIDWFLENGKNYEQIAQILSMDEGQVRLIALTEKEKIG